MKYFIKICLLFGSFLTMSSQAFSADRWIDWYIKQPDIFHMQFMCEDDFHYTIVKDKLKKEKPRARLLELSVYKKYKGGDNLAELQIKPASNNSQELFTNDDATGFYTFSGYVDDNRGTTVWYDFLPTKGVMQYHSMKVKRGRSVSWKANCTRID